MDHQQCVDAGQWIQQEGQGFTGIFPILMGQESDERFVEELRELKGDYGIDSFLIIPPPGFAILKEIFPPDFYRSAGKRIKVMQDAVRGDGIQLGVWFAPTFRAGLSKESEPMTNIGGERSPRAYCPLDEGWRGKIIGNMVALAEECHPFMILLEDDFELSHQPDVHFGCFCPRHLKKFAEQTGKAYTREELRAEFSKGNVALRREWGKLSKETLVIFARQLRASVDTVSPETRIGLCQAGSSRFDGDFSLDVIRALAGPRHRPFIRAFGSTYSSDSHEDFIGALASFKHYMDFYPEDIEIVHETDSYPHNAFFMSARKLDSLLTAALSFGAKGSLYYALQYLDNPGEEPVYLDRWKKNLPKWKTMASLIERRSKPVSFCRLTYRSDSPCGVSYDGKGRPDCRHNPWLEILGRYGFDATYLTEDDDDESAVIFVDVQDLRVMTDAEILNLLKRNLVLDGSAAHYLTRRGFGTYLGVEVVIDDKPTAVNLERIVPERMSSGIGGRLQYRHLAVFGSQEWGGFIKLKHPSPRTEVITEFVKGGDESQCGLVGMTLFSNELGGRILITAYDAYEYITSSIFNHRKRELMAALVEEMSGLPMPFRVRHANVYTILRRSREEGVFYATLIPLGTDTISPVDCRWATQPKSIRLLSGDGSWKELEWVRNACGGYLDLALNRMDPVFLEVRS